MITSKAAILAKTNQKLIIEEIQVPSDLEKGQILIKVEKAAICGSQLGEIKGIKGEDKYLPHLLGHEGICTIIKTWSGCTKFKPGDRVVAHWMKGSGIDAKPAKYFSSNFGNINSGPLAIFSEIAVASENRLTKIDFDFDFDFDLSSTLGCGLLTAYGVLYNQLNLSENSQNKILILGFGGIGQLLYLIGSCETNNNIFSLVEKNADLIDKAKSFGISDLHSCVDSLSDNYYTHVVDTTGNTKLIEAGYEALGKNGKLCLVGVTKINQKITIDPMPLHYGRQIFGSFGGGVNPDLDLLNLVKIIQGNLDHFKKFTFKHFRLDEINSAIEELNGNHSYSKALINFTHG